MSTSASGATMDPDSVFVYHERQEALLCGQHALNNLAQEAGVFTAGDLSEIAHQLDELELTYMAQNNEGGVRSADYLRRLYEGSGNVDAAGNFSIQVLKAALEQRYGSNGLTLTHVSHEDLAKDGKDVTDYQGFLCHKSDHWFAIRYIGGRFWNLNSMLERPVAVSHFQLATEMKKWRNEGYTIFCVPTGLPQGGVKRDTMGAGAGSKSSWHRMSDLLRGVSTAKDPWENLSGAGMRLDGKSTRGSTATAAAVAAANDVQIEGLTEEEQLQLALEASLEPSADAAAPAEAGDTSQNGIPDVPVPPEPAPGTSGSARIQFRFPDGRRVVRSFMPTDRVVAIYAYVKQQAPGSGQQLELRYGFPPKDMVLLLKQEAGNQITIGDARLAGESIQCRYV